MLFYFACEAAGALRARHSLRPQFFRANGFCKTSGASRRGNAETYLKLERRHCEERSDEAIHSYLAATWIASLALAMTVSTRATLSIVIARESGPSSIPETSVIEPRGRGVLDTLLEPVIGLAEGETRWRGMTAVNGSSEASKPLIPPRRIDDVFKRAAGLTAFDLARDIFRYFVG